jgi:hypothetical protein
MKLFRLLFSIKKIPQVSWSSKDPFNLRPSLTTFVFLVFGLFLFGLGESFLIASGAGTAPWTVLAQGVSQHTSFSIGFSTFLISVMVLLVWIPLKQKPGMGTILNAIILAIVIDASLPYLPNPANYTFKIIQVVIGVVIVGIGSGFYLVANLGAGPRDGLMIGLQKKTNLPIVSIRTILETSAVAAGWLMGGVVGLGTAIFAFGIGPAVGLGLYLVGKIAKPMGKE